MADRNGQLSFIIGQKFKPWFDAMRSMVVAGYYTNAPAAASANAGAAAIVADVAVADGALTVAAQPGVPRKLLLFKTDADSSAAFSVALVGKGPAGEDVSETVSFLATDGSTSKTTTKAYSKLTSATVSGTAGATGADKIAIGIATALGLPIPEGSRNVTVYKEATGATPAATPADEAVGTVDTTARTVVPTTAADGTKALHFWFTYNPL